MIGTNCEGVCEKMFMKDMYCGWDESMSVYMFVMIRSVEVIDIL